MILVRLRRIEKHPNTETVVTNGTSGNNEYDVPQKQSSIYCPLLSLKHYCLLDQIYLTLYQG